MEKHITREQCINYYMGLVMKHTKGTADPVIIKDIIENILDELEETK